MKKYKYLIIFYLITLIIIVNIKELKIKQNEINILFNNSLYNALNGLGVKENNIFRENYLFKFNFPSNEYIKNMYKIEIFDDKSYCLEVKEEIFINKNKKFSFKLYGKKQNSEFDIYSIYKIEVYENKKLLQTLFLKDILKDEDDDYSFLDECTYSFVEDSLFGLEDINFDGNLDIRLHVDTGIANESYAYWLFNIKENKFKPLDVYFEFIIDEENKQLISNYRNNSASYGKDYYKFDNNNNLIMIRTETEEVILINDIDVWVLKIINMPDEQNYILDMFYENVNKEDINIKVYGEQFEEFYIPKKIDVFKNNKKVQSFNLKNIKEINENIGHSNVQFFHIELYDINFDGYEDFGINIDFVDYDNKTYSYWLWNKQKNCFDYLITSSQINIDKEDKTIIIEENKQPLKYKFNEYNQLELIDQNR